MNEEKATREMKETPWSKTSKRNARSSLAYLLDPIDEAVFLRDFWGKRSLVRTGGDRQRFDGLFDLADLEEYLFVAKPPFGDVELLRDNEYPPGKLLNELSPPNYNVQALYAGLSAGYTMQVNDIHKRWPAARRLVDDLESRLLAPADAVVFVTAPNSRAFPQHVDNIDVFMLQTVGSKRWIVYDSVKGDTRQEVELVPGDMLYIPNGVMHSAETNSELSIHVSVRFFPVTWKSLASKCLDFMATRDPRWNETVPYPVLQGEGGASMVADIADRFREGLSNLSDVTPVVARHRDLLEARERYKNPAPSDYAISMIHLDQLDLETEVERRPGVGCYVMTDETSATLYFMGDTMRCPRSTADALQFVATTPRFRVGEIDDELLDASKVVLIRRLIRDGLLQLSTHGN